MPVIHMFRHSMLKNKHLQQYTHSFKLFFNEGTSFQLMTPKQVLSLESVGDIKIKELAMFINYQ